MIFEFSERQGKAISSKTEYSDNSKKRMKSMQEARSFKFVSESVCKNSAIYRKTRHKKIFLSWFLGWFSSQNWTAFNCYLLNKHPPIELHEKNCSNLGRIKEK